MAETRKSHSIDMCSGPMGKQIISFVIPIMVSNILQSLFNTADLIVVSKFCGSHALAAVGSTGTFINLLLGLFIGISTASNVIAAKQIGERNFEGVHKTVHTSILLGLVGGVFLSVLGILVCRTMLTIMGSPSDVIDLSELYLKIYFLGMPASLVYNFGSSILRAKGDTKRPLYIITLAGAANVCLNLFLVIVFKRSVDGVAIATITSQYISAFLVLRCLITDSDSTHFDFRYLKFDRRTLVSLLKFGIPAGFQGMMFTLSNMTVQSSVNSFGSNTMAAYAAASNLQGFLWIAANSFYQSNMTFTSQNLGAGKWDRINRSLKLNLLYGVSLCIVLGVSAYAFGSKLLTIYLSDASLISEALQITKFTMLPIFLICIMDTINGSARGLGYTTLPMICSLIGTCALRVIWILTVFKKFHTKNVLFAVYPVSWIVTIILYTISLIYIYRKTKRQWEMENSQKQ